MLIRTGMAFSIVLSCSALFQIFDLLNVTPREAIWPNLLPLVIQANFDVMVTHAPPCTSIRSLVLLPSCQRHHLVAIAWSLLVLQWSGDQAWLESCQAQWEQCSATSSSARESAVMRQVLARLRRRCQGSHFASLDLA